MERFYVKNVEFHASVEEYFFDDPFLQLAVLLSKCKESCRSMFVYEGSKVCVYVGGNTCLLEYLHKWEFYSI